MTSLEIKYFLGIVNNNCSFTKASQVLYISQPTLSQHIISLGKELGVKLLDTSNKLQVKLTPGGKILYQFFTEYDGILRDKITEAKHANAMPKGELKIASGTDHDIDSVIQSIAGFRSRHPNIDIRFVSNTFKQMENSLKNNYYDIIITTLFDFNKSAEYESSVIFEVPGILLFPANHALAQKKNLSIADFKNETFYVLSEDEKPGAKILQKEFCGAKGFTPAFQEFPNIDSIFLALKMGTGCALFDNSMRTSTNKAYRWFEVGKMIEIGFVWKKTNANPALRLFLDEVIFP